MVQRSAPIRQAVRSEVPEASSLFDSFPGLYAVLRERLFRDDTSRIVTSLWPDGTPAAGATLVELGCGPGFYARTLAARFPALDVVGIDRSRPLLDLAEQRADSVGLANCRFEWGDAQAISRASESVDAVIASRLITILPEPERAIEEIHRVLRPGGTCFIAEPRPHPLAHLPLNLLWVAAGFSRIGRDAVIRFREPAAPALLRLDEFASLIARSEWRAVCISSDRRYQYAVCEKS